MEYEKIAKKNRKKNIIDYTLPTNKRVNFGLPEVKKLTPHRDPFLLLDSIETVDFENRTISGKKKINPENPVFKGHFPAYPIYPGVLQVEMIGQLAICYYSLSKSGSLEVKETNAKLGVRALKIFHTLFQNEVLPGDEVTITAKVLESDEYKFKGIGQVLKDGSVCTVAIAEFYIV